jgi:hypothetical protein
MVSRDLRLHASFLAIAMLLSETRGSCVDECLGSGIQERFYSQKSQFSNQAFPDNNESKNLKLGQSVERNCCHHNKHHRPLTLRENTLQYSSFIVLANAKQLDTQE